MGKITREKQAKKCMEVYCRLFGFREPYQLLLDGNFIQVALLARNDLRDTLPVITHGKVKLMTTYCVHEELKALGPDFSGALINARRFEKRRCQHANPVPAAQCIASIIGEDNKHKYAVASQDIALREKLKNVPGTPLLYMKDGMVFLEQLSASTKVKKREIEDKKVFIPADLKPAASESAELAKGRKKKPKAPNPLSVKKGKKKGGAVAKRTPVVRKADAITTLFEKRKRRRKGKSGEDTPRSPTTANSMLYPHRLRAVLMLVLTFLHAVSAQFTGTTLPAMVRDPTVSRTTLSNGPGGGQRLTYDFYWRVEGAAKETLHVTMLFASDGMGFGSTMLDANFVLCHHHPNEVNPNQYQVLIHRHDSVNGYYAPPILPADQLRPVVGISGGMPNATSFFCEWSIPVASVPAAHWGNMIWALNPNPDPNPNLNGDKFTYHN
ncbi:Small subunit processome component, partial [Irineochytrium annulatum]